ncbi:MAG TPA: tetratricopeptide repeat protein [bacterium]|nr:tetratricopeptide repeat protein [bacterium]HPS30739.1 tetratricopeptide repeat protein [bacterium]
MADEKNKSIKQPEKKEHTLDDIKEMRKLLMRSLNSVSSLDASIKDIGKKINSKDQGEANKFFIAISLLGLVIILAFFFYFRTKVVTISERYDLLQKENDYLKKEISDQKEKLAAVENNDIKAYNLYLALKEGEPDQAFKLYREFNLSALSRLERMIIDSETSLIKQKTAVKKFEEGNILFNRKSYETAIDKFKESLEISSSGEHVANLFYLTSLCYYRMKDYNKAAISFERFLFVNSKKDFQKDRAELLLGVCYEKMNQPDRAKNFYAQILKDNRYNRYYPTIRDRYKNIDKKLEKQRDGDD